MLKEHPEIHLRPEVKYGFRCAYFCNTRDPSKLSYIIEFHLKTLKILTKILDGKRGLHYCLAAQKYVTVRSKPKWCCKLCSVAH